MARVLIISGISLVLIGLLWHLGSRWLPLGRLPGDIVVKKDKFSFYFPIVTCIGVSIVFSLIAYLIRIFK